jgi:hypothetical protein
MRKSSKEVPVLPVLHPKTIWFAVKVSFVNCPGFPSSTCGRSPFETPVQLIENSAGSWQCFAGKGIKIKKIRL